MPFVCIYTYLYHIFLIPLSIDGHSGCFHILIIVRLSVFLIFDEIHCHPSAVKQRSQRLSMVEWKVIHSSRRIVWNMYQNVRCVYLDPVCSLLGIYPETISQIMMGSKNFIRALFTVSTNYNFWLSISRDWLSKLHRDNATLYSNYKRQTSVCTEWQIACYRTASEIACEGWIGRYLKRCSPERCHQVAVDFCSQLWTFGGLFYEQIRIIIVKIIKRFQN